MHLTVLRSHGLTKNILISNLFRNGIRKRLLFLALLGLLGGCAAPQPEPPTASQAPLPKWYLHPPADNGIELFGVGEGATMEAATKQALADMAERIRVTLRSRETIRARSRRDVYEYGERTVTRRIDTRTEPLPIEGYRVRKSAHPAFDRYLVLVSLPKTKLCDALARSLRAAMPPPLPETGSWRRLEALQKSEDKMAPLRTRAAILQNVCPLPYQPVAETFTKRLKRIETMRRTLLSRLRIAIRPLTPAARPYAKILAQKLSRKGIALNEHAAVKLRIEVKERRYRYRGFYVVEPTVTLTLIDDDGTVVLSRTVALKGISALNDERAQKRALESFQKEI